MVRFDNSVAFPKRLSQHADGPQEVCITAQPTT